jgi:hypothetical protein
VPTTKAAWNTTWIRLGVLALPLSAVLLGVGNITRDLALGIVVSAGQSTPGGLTVGGSENLDPVANPEGFAHAVGSTGYAVGTLGITTGVALSVFGVFALFAYLAGGPARRWALAATVFSVAGSTLILPVFGVLTFAVPAVARAYLEGQQKALEMTERFLSTQLAAWALVASLFYVSGSILFGVAMWRSATLPKWAAIPYALSAPLLTFPLGEGTTGIGMGFLGLALILGGSGWIALSIWQNPAGDDASEIKPRVR